LLTSDGAAAVAGLLASQLEGGQLEISDGNGGTARADMTVVTQQAVVVCSATFGEQQANFEWRVRRVLDRAGQAVDEHAEDMGRKSAGAVWTLEADIELAPEE
jgi:hypothetical protein